MTQKSATPTPELLEFSKRFTDETLAAIIGEANSGHIAFNKRVLRHYRNALVHELRASTHRLRVDQGFLGISSLREISNLRSLPTARGMGPAGEFARLVIQNATYEGRKSLEEGDIYKAFVEAGRRCNVGWPIC